MLELRRASKKKFIYYFTVIYLWNYASYKNRIDTCFLFFMVFFQLKKNIINFKLILFRRLNEFSNYFIIKIELESIFKYFFICNKSILKIFSDFEKLLDFVSYAYKNSFSEVQKWKRIQKVYKLLKIMTRTIQRSSWKIIFFFVLRMVGLSERCAAAASSFKSVIYKIKWQLQTINK